MESCHQCHGIPYHVHTISYSCHISYHTFYIVSHVTWYTILPSSGADEIWWDSVVPALQPNFRMLMQQPIFQHSAHGLKNPGRDDKGEKVTKIHLSHYCFDCNKKNSRLQFYSSTVYKMQDTLYTSISFWLKSRYSRLISGVMTITPLFSLWCRISWWSKPYCSQGSESASMMALTSPNIERQETQARGREVNCWRQLQQMPQSSSDQNVCVHVEDPVTLTS